MATSENSENASVDNGSPSPSLVRLTMTQEQAQVVVQALDLFSRIGIGQVEQIAEQVRWGALKIRDEHDEGLNSVRHADWQHTMEEIETACYSIKAALGYPPHGSAGIGGEKVSVRAKRSWEIMKQIDQHLAMQRNPNPAFKTVNYDGRILPLTDDPDILVESVQAEPRPSASKKRRPRSVNTKTATAKKTGPR